jgi:hypothetical protein|nr:MAG TPA: hypothetical protein [Caudoviricetes sp.]
MLITVLIALAAHILGIIVGMATIMAMLEKELGK